MVPYRLTEVSDQLIGKIRSTNRRNLTWINEEPLYSNLTPAGSKPYTLFKSVYTNNTNRPQEYSFKTERTTESLCSISREQGYTIGAEAELTLKTPLTAFKLNFLLNVRLRLESEIAELKAGFKHEMHFNNLNENCQTEILTWGVDSSVQVPPHYSTEASIIIEEMNYRGSYSVVTKLSGNVTISIKRRILDGDELSGKRKQPLQSIPLFEKHTELMPPIDIMVRRKDDALMLPIRVNIAEVFIAYLDSPHCRKEVKQVVSVDQRKIVRLLSKGTCHFQFAMKQKIDLKENPIHMGNELMID
ncbi:hypothetical protein DICVIV_05403 [Dictyocaulus viviparus]|uniref:Uncharacterized protein n=1 Tax=Dictyocaulus viviparus TaxID=29172 RepID=A0A0D8XXE2_DICVI|nr:hypothetical protein DICVIV_05403 [Dictyocaulus viviparus]